MMIVSGNVLANHQRLASTIRHGRDFHRLLKRLAKKEATTPSIAAAVVVRGHNLQAPCL